MITYRLQYRFLLMFIVFALTFVFAFSLVIQSGAKAMIEEMEKQGPVTAEQRAVQERYRETVTENLISFSFYIFILAFVFSLFLSRRFLQPLRELHRGAKAIRDGRLDIKLNVQATYELAEVTKAFNEMAETLRKKTKELLRKDLYITTMTDPLWVVNEDNIVVDVNPAFTKLFGYERQDVIGSPIFDFLDAEAEKVMRAELLDRERGVSSMYEISIISKTEGLIPVLISGTPIIENEKVVGKIGIMKDFRGEAALRDALRDEKDHTVTIMDSMTDDLIVVDRDFRIVQANAAARMAAGRDISGSNCHDVFHSIDKKCFMLGADCPVRTVFETGKPYKVVHEHVEEGGKTAYREILAYPVRDRDGDVRHVVEVMRDVTERKKFEEEIEMKNKELTALYGISRALGQSLRAEDVFTGVLEQVTGLLGMDGGGIFFLDEMGKELRCLYQKGISEDFIRSIGRLRVGEDIPGRVALTGNSFLTPDISKDARGEKSILRHSGIKAYGAFPVKGKEKMLGVFVTFSFAPHVFSPEEERILSSISVMMGIAIENIRLYEKMRALYDQQRQRRAREQRNLLDLSFLLASNLDIRSVLNSSLSLIKDSCGADFVWLLVPDGAGNMTVEVSSPELFPPGQIVFTKNTGSLESHAIQQRRPVTLSEISAEPPFGPPDELKGYSAACSMPVFIGDRTIGAFTLYYRPPKNAKQEDVDFIQTVSSMLSVAVERARLYENVIIEKEMAAAVLESIADGVMTVDASCRVMTMNRAAEELIGLKPKSSTGLPCCDIFNHAEENMELRWKLGECLEEAIEGRAMTVSADLIATSGRHAHVMLRSAPVRDPEGRVTGVVYVLRDISREKKIDNMKSDFIRQVSHAFRTPLSSIVGMTEMILNKDVTGHKVNEYLNAMLSEGKRLAAMVSDQLDLTKIEEGKVTVELPLKKDPNDKDGK